MDLIAPHLKELPETPIVLGAPERRTLGAYRPLMEFAEQRFGEKYRRRQWLLWDRIIRLGVAAMMAEEAAQEKKQNCA